MSGHEHDVWIGPEHVLSLKLDKGTRGFPPSQEIAQAMGRMIQGLSRASRAVIHHSEDQRDPAFHMQPVEDISDAIILLSQLREAVESEIKEVQP